MEIPEHLWAWEVERVVNLIASKVAEDTPRYYGDGIRFELTLTMHRTDKFKEAVVSALATSGIRAYYSSESPTIIAKAGVA